MKRYKDLSGDSGVIAYETGKESITVKFKDGIGYEYTYQSAGRENIENMKALAVAGRGLSTYIVQHVRKMYARKR